jgi:DNA repair photolyase
MGRTIVYGNLPALVKRDLEKFAVCPPVSISNATDPCQDIPPLRDTVKELVRVLIDYGIPFSIITKNDPLFLLGVDGFEGYPDKCVAVTIEGTEKILGLLSPSAPPFRDRLKAVERLSSLGIRTSVRFDPVFPHLFRAIYGTRWQEEIESLIRAFASAGSRHVVSSTGTLKKRPASFHWGKTSSFERIRKVVETFSRAEADSFSAQYIWDQKYTSRGYRLGHGERLEFHRFLRGLCAGLGMTYAVCLELLSEEADSSGLPGCGGFRLPFVRKGPDGRFREIEGCSGNCLQCQPPVPPCGRNEFRSHAPFKRGMLLP